MLGTVFVFCFFFLAGGHQSDAFPTELDDDENTLDYYGVVDGGEILMNEIDIVEQARETERRSKQQEEMIRQQEREACAIQELNRRQARESTVISSNKRAT